MNDVWKLATPPGSLSPTLLRRCGFFYVPQEPDKWKCCETRLTVFCPYPWEDWKVQPIVDVIIQRQHFLLSYLKTLSVGLAGVRTCDLLLSRPALSQLCLPGGGWVINVKLSLSAKQLSYQPFGLHLHCVHRTCQLDRHASLKVQEKGDKRQKSCNMTGCWLSNILVNI